MKVIHILNNTLGNVTKKMHARRKDSLFSCIESALNGASSTVTSIGRGIRSNAYEKHNIKRADRLLSNKKLNADSINIYKSIAKTLISPGSRPIVLVDWSDLDPYKCNFLIRATLAMNGRGLTIYEEVHGIEHKEKPKTHKRFLQTLAKIIDVSCEPIIVTDAGFKVPWFKQVQSIGWDFVGRTRLPNTYSLDGLNWPSIKSLYKKATTQPKSFSGFITKSNPLAVNLALYKEKPKGRKNLTRCGKVRKSAVSLKYAKGAKDPWLISTSLKMKSNLGKRLVEIYKTRMQIEEGFRDMKSHRYGLGLGLHQSYKTERLANLVLITTLANFVVFLTGTVAIMINWHRRYQANTVKNKMVLSRVFIGLRVLSDRKMKLTKRHLNDALDRITLEMNELYEGLQ